MKKSVFAFLAFVCGLLSFNAAQAFSNNMTGFYLGPDLGYGVANVKLKYINPLISIPNVNLPPLRNIDDDAAIFGPFAGLHVGYQKDTNAIVFGGEIYLTLGSLTGKIRDRNPTFPLEIQTTRNFGFGGAFKLGGKLNKIVLYAKLAADFSQFRLKLQDAVIFPPVNIALKKTNSKYLFGVGPGLGVEGLVSKSLILGAEWTLIAYQSKNMITQANGIPITAKIKPMVSEFRLRLSMKL